MQQASIKVTAVLPRSTSAFPSPRMTRMVSELSQFVNTMLGEELGESLGEPPSLHHEVTNSNASKLSFAAERGAAGLYECLLLVNRNLSIIHSVFL